MSDMLAVLVYLFAIALPIYLLYHYHPLAWYWHSLAIAAAISLGFIPIPSPMQGSAFDLIFGFAFTTLLIWGVCGLLLSHHAHHQAQAHQ